MANILENKRGLGGSAGLYIVKARRKARWKGFSLVVLHRKSRVKKKRGDPKGAPFKILAIF